MPEEQRKALAREALKLARFRIQKNLPVFGGALAVPNEAWTDGRSGMYILSASQSEFLI